MAVQDRAKITVEEFERLAALPENADRRLEYIEGRLIEVVTNNLSSELGGIFLIEIGLYVRGRKLGRVTGADGGYKLGRHRVIPDVGFISKQKQSKSSRETWNSQAPDLVVEVLSPTDRPDEVQKKIAIYLRAGTTVWLADADERQGKVYDPIKPSVTLTIDDSLEGGDALPGFTMPLRQIFDQLE